MPAIVDRVVIGREQLEKVLAQLPGQVRRNALRRGLYAAAVLIRDDARRRAPIRYGFLRKQIVARAGARRADENMAAYVSIARGRFVKFVSSKSGRTRIVKRDWKISTLKKGSFYNPRRYAHLVEFGTQRSRKRPFLLPAAKAMESRILDAIAEKIREDLRR